MNRISGILGLAKRANALVGGTTLTLDAVRKGKALLVLAADAVLFLNMMNAIRLHGEGGNRFALLIGVAAGVALVILNTMRNKGEK